MKFQRNLQGYDQHYSLKHKDVVRIVVLVLVNTISVQEKCKVQATKRMNDRIICQSVALCLDIAFPDISFILFQRLLHPFILIFF